MNRLKIFLLLLISLLIGGCAKIPQESVTLSSHVSSEIQKQYLLQVKLVNLYFSQKREMLNHLMNKEIEEYFNLLIPNDKIELTKSQIMDIFNHLKSVNNQYAKSKEELEKSRLLLLEELNKNFINLQKANDSITNLIKSAIEVDETKKDVYDNISKLTKDKINIQELISNFDQLILKSGDKSQEANKLIEKIKKLLEKKE